VGMPIAAAAAVLFFISYSLFALKIIFPIHFSGILAMFFLLFTLTNYLNLSLWDFKRLSYRRIFVAITPIFLELFTILEFAPIPAAARGAIIGLAYYLFSGLLYLGSLPVLDRKLLKTYVAVTIASAVLILMAAQWR
jgi:hypothetical protein